MNHGHERPRSDRDAPSKSLIAPGPSAGRFDLHSRDAADPCRRPRRTSTDGARPHAAVARSRREEGHETSRQATWLDISADRESRTTRRVWPRFYDDVYELEDRWKLPYWQMQWYGSWAVVADRALHMDSPRVLDMGCGTGQLGRILCDRGLELFTGFDFSPKRLEYARRLVPEFRFELADAYTTDLFETVDYTLVTCCEFLEHLEGDLAVLGRIPSGNRVIGTVPDYDAKAHLRVFADEQEVRDRYGSHLTDLCVDRIRNTGGGSEFLIDGWRV